MKRSLIALCTMIALASCGGDGEKKANNTQAELAKLKKERLQLDKKITELEATVRKNNPLKAIPVVVDTVRPTEFKSYLEIQAAVTGDENVLATPQAPGVVSSIHVRTGQRVGRGQVLATLDAAAVDQQVKAQEAQLTLTRQLYEKQSKLWEQNIGSEVQLLTAKANYESTQKQYEALKAQRNMYRIISPISGTVDEVSLKIGDMANPGQSGIRVVSMSKLKAQASLGENYIGKVQTGDPVILTFGETGNEISTKLSYVSKSVNPISRAFNVEVNIGNNKDIRPNMSCKMNILSYANNNAITVPVSAVQSAAEGKTVFVVENKKAKSVVVETGRNANGMVEILSGLKAGDKVITEGYTEVDNGRAVEIE